MKTEKRNPTSQFSIFDSIEHLSQSSQSFLSKCDKKLIKPLSKLFHQWEKVITGLVNDRQSRDQELSELKEKYCQSKDAELKLRIKLTHKKSKESEMIQEIQAIKDHLEEGKEMWAKQIKRIEEVMQEQERAKQRVESLYQQRLTEIDKELDDIMHIHKKKLGLSQNLGEILPGLFSVEELLEEKQIALGEISQRQQRDLKILKIEGASNEDICSENSEPEMNLDDLTGTQKLIFQRLLDLRRKVRKFKHDETTCSEASSNYSLPLELKSLSHSMVSKAKPALKYSKTSENLLSQRESVLFCRSAGIVFGLNGSEKYRTGLTNLLKSEKLSVSQRELIVFNLINPNLPSLSAHLKTVNKSQLIKQEDWGDMSSIHGENKEPELSQDLQHIFSKKSLSLSKVSLAKAEAESIDLDVIFANDPVQSIEVPLAPVELSKDQEMSSMSILKDFSRNISTSSKRKLSEESRKDHSVLDVEDVVSSRRKFSVDQREPGGNLVIPPNLNLYFVPEPPRPRSNPRVTLKPEEPARELRENRCKDLKGPKEPRESKESLESRPRESRESSVEDSYCSAKHSLKSDSKKPISMMNKLPILPKPPSENKKTTVKTFRGRSLQPVQPGPGVKTGSPPGRKIQADIKSASPATALKFRMRRFKEPASSKPERKKEGKSLLVKRATRVLN